MSKKTDQVLGVRIPDALRERVEEFCNEAGYERPSAAVRVLLEAGLQHYANGAIDVDRLTMIQHNANAQALEFTYGVLSEVVERVTSR